MNVRDVLGEAWTLFQVCLPTCLPLAVVGVAAGATPNAEIAASGGQGYLHSREWWGLAAASSVLMLICYGAVLRQQLSLASGARPQLLESLRGAARDLPFVLVLVLLWLLPLVPAAVITALRGFDAAALVLTLLAMALLVYAVPAWPALIAHKLAPWTAVATSIRRVHGQWRDYAGVVGVLLTAVLVFVLLAGILLGMVMGLAGQGTKATVGGLAFSRWMMALVLAVPVVYSAAVSVTVFRAGQPLIKTRS
jgi:hypothetical protein